MKIERLWDATLCGPVPTGSRKLSDLGLTRKRYERIVRQYSERQNEIHGVNDGQERLPKNMSQVDFNQDQAKLGVSDG